MLIKTVIFGLGRIGAEYPKAGMNIFRNHLEAILNQKEFRLIGLVDKDIKKIDQVKKNYSILKDEIFFKSINQISKQKIDLIIISTPTCFRVNHIKLALNQNPKMILIEKPLAKDLKDAKSIVELCNKSKSKVYLNFTRRYNKGFQEIKKKLGNNKPKLVLFRYNNGLINYGSHFIDFLISWYGKVDFVQAINADSLSKFDKSISFFCRLKKNIDVMAQIIVGVEYDQFEIELYFKNFKVSMINGGKEKFEYRGKKSLYYQGYTHLEKGKKLGKQDFVGDLNELYKILTNYFLKKKSLEICNLEDAFYNMKILEAINKSYLKKKTKIQI